MTNRVIKFRAWANASANGPKQMFEWEHYSDLISEWIANGERGAVVMQFTGLTDKNGKEIYEGDVVRYSIQGDEQTNPYHVENIWDLHVELSHDDAYYRIDEYSLEVIGNIYENLELLSV